MHITSNRPSILKNFSDVHISGNSWISSKTIIVLPGINFNSLFCPGYTRYGYKSELGHTTKWKLEELSKIRDFLDSYGIKSSFKNYYSDVFLENTDSKLEPNWKEQMEKNRW